MIEIKSAAIIKTKWTFYFKMNVNDHLRFKMQNKSCHLVSNFWKRPLVSLPSFKPPLFSLLNVYAEDHFYYLIVHKRYVKLLILSQTNAFDNQAFIKRF